MFAASATRTNAGITARASYIQENETLRDENRELRIKLSVTKAKLDSAMSTIRHQTDELRNLREIQEFNEKNPWVYDGVLSYSTARQILARFDGVLGIGIRDMKAKKSTRTVSRVRQAAIYWVKRRANLSCPQIGLIFGQRDHTTIMHACRAHVARKEKRGAVLKHVVGEESHHG